MKVAILGSIGIILLASAVILHDTLHGDQHSDSWMSVLITVMGSVILIFAHMRNRKLCAKHNYEGHE
jgi:MerC mercury resistance protein.